MLDYNDMVIIGTTSYGTSGGSALTNILEEFDCISTAKGGATFECKFFSNTLFRLETALRSQLFVNEAVKEMLYQALLVSQEDDYSKNFGSKYFLEQTKKYIENITGKWLGGMYSEKDLLLISPHERGNLKKTEALYSYLKNNEYHLYEQYPWRPSFQPLTEQYYGKFDNNFYKRTQEYTSKLFAAIAVKNKSFILIDGLFRPESVIHELNWFANARCTVVDRDPRDHYIMNKLYWGEAYLPTWTVETYINWFKTYRSCAEKFTEYPDKILPIQFENLIYNYEESLTKIKKFFNLKDSGHVKKGQIFIPDKSKTNTQIFRKHPQYIKDIEKIEKELSEFCYPYSEGQIQHFLPEEIIKKENHATLEDIRKIVCVFQKTGKLPFSNIKGAYISTIFISSLRTLQNRKTSFSKMKGVIKLVIGAIIFPMNILFCWISIAQYQNENKDKMIEFK